MSWASEYIQKLLAGETVKFRPRGNSMSGRIESGQLVTVEPIDDCSKLQIGDIILCKVKGKVYLHLISAIKNKGGELRISNNHGYINGWTSSKNIYGKCTKIEI